MDETGDLLKAIALARFGDSTESSRRRLLLDLQNFHRLLAERRTPTVTPAAIRNWFSSDREVRPKRVSAKRFLFNYLLWADDYNYVVDRDVFKGLYASLSPFGPDQEVGWRPGTSIPQDWDGDAYTWDAALKTKGLYQIIRPSARKDAKRYRAGKKVEDNEKEDYILEVLAIDPTHPPQKRVAMYSHRDPDRNHLYTGRMFQSTRAMFSLLSREHSNISSRKSFRTISTCISDINHTECFSGMLTRSMSDDSDAGKRIMASPFVAIRTPHNPSVIFKEDVLYSSSLDANILSGSLVIGHLTADERKQASSIIEICHSIFSSLIDTFHFYNGDDALNRPSQAIVTSAPDNLYVRSKVEQRLGESSFYGWSEVVRKALS